MKEIIAIIRPKQVVPTKEALAKLGIPSITAIPVLGRGKQCGIAAELNIDLRPNLITQGLSAGQRYMEYIPKRLLSVVACNQDVDAIVKAIIEVNQTGQIGDGKIFVCPVDNAIRIRTDETGDKAIQ
jgi:nitrogen regulatory protein PII 2